jgi:hypothetical protein
MTVLWDAVGCSLVEAYCNFRGACCLCNISKLQDCVLQQPRRQSPSYSPLWELEISSIRTVNLQLGFKLGAFQMCTHIPSVPIQWVTWKLIIIHSQRLKMGVLTFWIKSSIYNMKWQFQWIYNVQHYVKGQPSNVLSLVNETIT